MGSNDGQTGWGTEVAQTPSNCGVRRREPSLMWSIGLWMLKW